MRELRAFVMKEFHHIFRDKRTVLILLVMPIIQIILFGFAISVEIKNVNVAVVIPEHTENIRKIVQQIDANQYFKVVGALNRADDIDKLMRRGKIDMALIFSNNFDREPSIEVVVDASNPNTASLESSYLSGILNNTTHGTNIKMLYNPQMKSAYTFVPGIMGLIFILICAMMTSVSIVREKETGTMEILLASPVKPINIIFAKMTPYFVLSFVNLATILLLARYLLDVPISGSIIWICFLSIIYIFLSLALGLLISTLVKTQMAAMLCSAMILMLPVIMLSGMIFPVESMPGILQWLTDIVPAKWYISGTKKLMIEGLGARYIIKEITILVGMAALISIIAISNFKKRLE